MRGVTTCGIALSASLGLPGGIAAQSADVVPGQRATRAEVATRVQTVQTLLASPSMRKDARGPLEGEMITLQGRLTDGDFQVGDRFVFTIAQDSVRSDTASVRNGLVVSILNLPDFSVRGVLRSELTDRLQAHVARYVRNVTVRTSVLTRVAILGAVQTPGYYYAAPDRPISELVMMAGGPGVLAKLGEFEVKRGTAVVVSVKDSKRAVKEGRTLEQVDVRSGDEVYVPVKKKFNWTIIMQLFSIASVLFFSVFQFLQWYYSRQG
ncbi:MAG: hypothetical protein IPP90_01295 [Gemmatimonadaceae bacterium]|nr:hypothetical protein [Gemmatimonadaceae bacterium]